MTAAPAEAAPDAAADLRARILRAPSLVLDDRELMAALIAAAGGEAERVVDLRGALVKRLEERLARLEHAHRSVIAAAYENLAGAGQIHRAALRLLDAGDANAYLSGLLTDAPDILALDAARLALEPGPGFGALDPTLAARVVDLPEGGVDAYLALDDGVERDGVWLRAAPPEAELIFGDEAAGVGSEALIALRLGDRRGLLAFGAADARRFSPEHGVDLVAFLGGVVARTLPRWLTA